MTSRKVLSTYTYWWRSRYRWTTQSQLLYPLDREISSTSCIRSSSDVRHIYQFLGNLLILSGL